MFFSSSSVSAGSSRRAHSTSTLISPVFCCARQTLLKPSRLQDTQRQGSFLSVRRSFASLLNFLFDFLHARNRAACTHRCRIPRTPSTNNTPRLADHPSTEHQPSFRRNCQPAEDRPTEHQPAQPNRVFRRTHLCFRTYSILPYCFCSFSTWLSQQ